MTRNSPRRKSNRPSSMASKRRRRGPNPWIIAGSVVGGIVVVGLLVVLITSNSESDTSAKMANDDADSNEEISPNSTPGSLFSPSTGQPALDNTNRKKDRQSVFAELPNHPNLEVTDKNWTPNPEILSKLGSEQRAGKYVIRLPDEAQSAHHLANLMFPRPKGHEVDAGFVWKWPSPLPGQYYGITFFYDSWEQANGPSQKELNLIQEGVLNTLPGILNRKTQRGFYRGLPAWISTQETAVNGQRSYEIIIQAVDGEYNIGIQALSPTPPGTPGYEQVKAAILSIHRKS